METQEEADPSVEVYFASLDAGSKKGTLPDIENSSDHSKTVRMDKTPNADPITYSDVCHNLQLSRECAAGAKEFLRHRCRRLR
jgi:hypothetical protein